jgi:putative FmdB family regulatory protein
MPTYEFRCPDGTIVERVFKMSEVPESIPNPHGEGEAVRIISGGDFVLKGSGFYMTDYGKDGKKDQRDAQAKAAKSAESKSETKSESKSDSSSAAPSAPAAAPAAPASTPTPKADS